MISIVALLRTVCRRHFNQRLRLFKASLSMLLFLSDEVIFFHLDPILNLPFAKVLLLHLPVSFACTWECWLISQMWICFDRRWCCISGVSLALQSFPLENLSALKAWVVAQEVFATEVLSLVNLALSFQLLQDEIVASCLVVMLVCIEVADNFFSQESFLLEINKNWLLVKHMGIPHDEAFGSTNRDMCALKPFVIPNVLYCISLCRITYENALYQVSGFLSDEIRYFILAD